jgi:hypothetical protein
MENNSEKGPVLGIIIIIVLLVAGGLFVLNNSLTQPEISLENVENMPDTQSDNLGLQATSTELDAIESDANATDLSNLDSEIDQIEAELQ